MRIAVLGNSPVNEVLKREAEFEGFEISELSPSEIKAVKGKNGEYSIKTGKGEIDASYIVVTGDLNVEDLSFPQGALSLYEADADDFTYSKEPVVFVMDFLSDSSAFGTREALSKALKLAKRRQNTVILAKSVKTAGEDLENIYKEARNFGVRFIKYYGIEIEYSDREMRYKIAVNDGSESIEIETKTIVFDVSESGGELKKLLRLRTGSRFFLFPSLTARKGVYIIERDSSSGSLREMRAYVRFLLSDIKRETRLSELSSYEPYAKVEAEKCAFCYTCFRACPHTAMEPDPEKPAMKCDPGSCRGCGICVSVCPAKAIVLAGKAENKTECGNAVKVFCCGHSGDTALKRIEESLEKDGIELSWEKALCGGELTAENILNSLKKHDFALAAVCMDDACRHFDGNKRAENQAERAKEILRAAGLDENRVQFLKLSFAMPDVLETRIRAIVKEREGVI